VPTTKGEPTESADEAIAPVQSAEEPDSSTGNVNVLQALSVGDDKPVNLTTKKESNSDSSESTQGKVRGTYIVVFLGA